jgi:hypothetical protein
VRIILTGLKSAGQRVAAELGYHVTKAHVLRRINHCQVGTEPYRHMFIDNILPEPAYAALRQHMLRHKHGNHVRPRRQDNPLYVNRRYSLVGSPATVVAVLRRVFSDTEVKWAFLRKFYLEPSRELAAALQIHEEFEYIYTQAGRFQNIHVDIPPKFLSFVFYIPEERVTPEAEEQNATILYDRDLQPRFAARFRANSVCVFVPHFYSYHGFSSTIDRDVLVMFYIHPELKRRWDAMRGKDVPPFDALKDAIAEKLIENPLIEYGRHPSRIVWEQSQCRVNAKQGRVLRD